MRSRRIKQSNTSIYMILVIFLLTGLFIYARQPLSSGSSSSEVISTVIQAVKSYIPGYSYFQHFFELSDINFIVRKSIHIMIYAILSCFIWKILYPRKYSYIIAWSIATAAAILDEWHQSFISWRTAEVGDVILDSLAAFFALLIVYMTRKDKR